MDWNTVVIVDADDTRRNAIYRCLAPAGPAIPVARLGELGQAWPQSAWFLVHDEATVLDTLYREFARRGVFYPIILFSEDLRPDRVVETIHGGAMNYIAWPFDAARVRKALRDVAEVARRRCEHASARMAAQDKISQLTARELEVVRAMRSGMTSKEIGRGLGISHRTVEIHRANAMAKLGAGNSAGIVTLLVEGEDGGGPGALYATEGPGGAAEPRRAARP